MVALEAGDLAAPVLEIRDLEKRYGNVEVLKGITLEMAAGDLLAIHAACKEDLSPAKHGNIGWMKRDAIEGLAVHRVKCIAGNGSEILNA